MRENDGTVLVVAADPALRARIAQTIAAAAETAWPTREVDRSARAIDLYRGAGRPLCVVATHEPPLVDAFELLAARPADACCPVVVLVDSAGDDAKPTRRALFRAGAADCVDVCAVDASTLKHAVESAAERAEVLARPGVDYLRRASGEDGPEEAFDRRVLDSLFAFAGLLELDGTLVDANRAPLEAAGLELADVVGKKFWDCYWWSYSERVQDELRVACARAARGEIVRYDASVRTANEGRIVIAFQIAPLYDEAGRVTHLVPSAVDITDRKRAEDALRQSEATLSAVLDALPVGVIVADARGKILRDNAANRELWGMPPLSTSWQDYGDWVGYDPESGERIQAHEWAMARAITKGEIVKGELVECERFDDGQRRLYLNNAAPVRDASGAIVGGVVAELDVTERVATERALRESEARFRALADNISQLAWMTDETGYIFWFNQRWFEYTGASPDEMRGWGWQKAYHPDHVERVVEKFRRHIASGEPWEDTFPLRSAGGTYRWFLSRARPIKDEAGTIVRWFGTNTDVTAQREAEEALRQAIHLRDEFLSVASHELRTPLTALGLQLEQLRRLVRRRDDGAGDKTEQKVEAAIRQADRLGALVEGLLDVSRITSGRLVLRLETFDLAEVVRDVVERLTEVASRARCEIRLTTKGASVLGTWDRSRVDQVLVNLLTNAVKYGPGAPVDVELRADDHGVVLTVRDRGIGIADADRDRIFGRFERAVSARHYGGLGLGLYIARQIVEAHGGEIDVSSSPGCGSTFIVRLPLTTRGSRPELGEAPVEPRT